MLNGALGTVAFFHSGCILTYPDSHTTIVSPLITEFTLNAADIAEVSATVTGQATYNWTLSLSAGDGTWLSANSGTVYNGTLNTFTVTSLLRANTTGSFTLNFHITNPQDKCGIGDGLLLITVIARDA